MSPAQPEQLDAVRVHPVHERARARAGGDDVVEVRQCAAHVLLRYDVAVEDELLETAVEQGRRSAGRRRRRCLESQQSTGQLWRAASNIRSSSVTDSLSTTP